jgi:2-polyprenyl-3-methyl-5-hydroxy-6-metoxy-1,4-benzoquinol methylase
MSARAGLKRFLTRFPRLLLFARTIRSALSPDERIIRRLQRNQTEQFLQPSPTTRFDRHPTLFAFAQQRLAGRSDIRLLSFGCSTGEEPLSLASYMPDAIIDAIDINPRSIAAARRNATKMGNNRISFELNGQPPAVDEFYDAVFCLSVLRHGQLDGDQPKSCSEIFPFAKYESVIAALDRTIRPGGLLFIWGSNFHFTDCAVAERYHALDIPDMRPHGGAFYGSDDGLLESSKAVTFAFEKLR